MMFDIAEFYETLLCHCCFR